MKQLLLILFLVTGALSVSYKTGYIDEDLTLTLTETPTSIVYVKYHDLINSTGWSLLTVRTNSQYSDQQQAYTAGVAEGMMTAHRISQSWDNTMAGYCVNETDLCTKLESYITDNNNWMGQMIDKYRNSSSYWYQVDLVLQQLAGLHYGFNRIYPGKLSLYDFYLMNMMGDLIDLETALGSDDQDQVNKSPVYEGISREKQRILQNVLGSGHCSAFIKWTGEDLLTSHVTWNNYFAMIRIIKNYQFNFRSGPGDREGDTMPGSHQVFTSYPGYLFSGDDYNLLGSGIVTQETTIANFNADRWKYIHPQNSVPEYLRSVVANRLAKDGEAWCSLFEKYNSGTYNNQWMVVNYNLFHPGEEHLEPGTFHLLEQLPGYVRYQDLSSTLERQAYWPSFNTPYFTDVFNMSGYQEWVDKFGPMFSYDLNPRALIFKRDQKKVTGLDSLYDLMRSNNYKHDPYARCEDCLPPYSAINAISARSDLNPTNGTYPLPLLGPMLSGAVDYKGTSHGLMKGLGLRAASGPTWEQQPPFRWSGSDWENVTHRGIPDLLKFQEMLVIFQ